MKNSFGNCQQQTSRKGSTFVSNRTVGHIRPKTVVRNEWGTKRDADFPRQLMGLISHVWIPFCSVAKSCLTLSDTMDCSTPGLPVLHYLPKLAQTHVHWVDDTIQPSYPLSPLLLLPSILPSIKVFSSELALRIRWPKYWSFSFSNRPTDEYSGLISFRIDWFDLFAVQRTPKSLLQHHNLCVDITNVFLVTLPMPSLSSFTY